MELRRNGFPVSEFLPSCAFSVYPMKAGTAEGTSMT
jgi:hypothetical protein